MYPLMGRTATFSRDENADGAARQFHLLRIKISNRENSASDPINRKADRIGCCFMTLNYGWSYLFTSLKELLNSIANWSTTTF